MFRRLQVFLSIPLALAFAFQILLTTPALAGLTLCIEVDGHIGIEAEKDDCCPPAAAPFSDPSTYPDPSYSLEKETCVSCIDVALGDGSTGAQSASGAHGSNSLLGSSKDPERLLPFKVKSTPYLPRLSAAMSSMAAIQTIVLRV